MRRMRKWALLVMVFALVATACSDDGGETTTTAAPSGTTAAPTATTAGDGDGGGEAIDTLKIGVLLPLTGNVAGPGADAQAGLELFFDQFGNEHSGVNVEFIVEDTASDPETARQKTTKLVEVDDVDIIIPGILANVGNAVVSAAADDESILFLSPYSCNDDFTQRAPIDRYARPGGWSCSQSTHAFGKWAYEEAGYQTIATACSDYTFGYEHCGGFVDAFTSAGGTVVSDSQLWFPLGPQDFSTYMTQLNDIAPDAVMTLPVGGASIEFVTAYSDFGLKDGTPMLAGAVVTDQSVLRNMDKDAALGTISHGHWAEGADIPETQEFVALYEEATGNIPSYYSAANYAAMQWITETLARTGGEFSPELFIETMKDGMVVNTPFGPQTLDQDASPILNVYIREVVEREDGKLWNVPIFTYENVDQYFPFERETYLQQPSYTREFQGLNAG